MKKTMTDSDKKTQRLAALNKYYQLKSDIHPESISSKYNILVPINNGAALLFNSISRGLCLLDQNEKEIYETLERNQEVNRKENLLLLKQLATEGFLVSPEHDECASLQQRYEDQRNDTSRLGLTIAPTMGCNLACGYCFQGVEKETSTLTKALTNNILSIVQERIETITHLSVTWYGGEPLMKSKKLFALSEKLIALCQQYGVFYNAIIVTNGVYLNADIATRLLEQGCGMAQVTIDGPKEMHDLMRPTRKGGGSFERIMLNIADVLKNTKMHISMRVNVGKDNVSSCGALLDDIELRGLHHYDHFSLYFAPIDASTVQSGTAFENSLGQKKFDENIAPHRTRAKKMGIMAETQPPGGIMGLCVATIRSDMVLAPNGEVHKCWETMHESSMKVGRFTDLGIIKNENDLQNQRLWDEWTPFENSVCKNCKILPLCGGKCAQRFVYFSEGGHNALPCPEWKYNTAELIFERAKERGYVSEQDWIEGYSTFNSEISGKRHNEESMNSVCQQIHEKVNNEPIVQN